MVSGFRGILERDRTRMGFTVGQVAWRIDVSPREYRELVESEAWHQEWHQRDHRDV